MRHDLMPHDAVRALPRWVWALLMVASALLLGYTASRAALLSLTFDEAWSLNSYARASWGDILGFRPVSANNHLGNSLLMKLCAMVSTSPFSLRLPNVVAHALYLTYAVALARRMRQGVWVLLAFFLLNFHPYILDFFSLARGYGLAMAMVMGALYHLFAFRENAFTRHIIWNAVFAALSVIFNLSFLHFFLADAVVLVLLIYSHSHAWNEAWRVALGTAVKRVAPIVLAALCLYLLFREPIRALVAAKELYYGGNSGFWTDTVFSLAHALLYKIDYWRHDVSALLLFGIVSLCGMFLTFGIELSERRFSLRTSPGALALILLLIPAVTCTVQHFEFGSLFLIYRTALFLVPIYMLGLVWMLRTMARIPQLRPVTVGLSLMIVALLGAHNVRALNFTHCAEWPFDADTATMMQDLASDRAAQGNASPISIGLSWQLRPGTDYYRKLWNYTWLQEPSQVGCQPGFAYYYVLNNGEGCKLDDAQLPFGKKQGCVLLKEYPVSNTALWRSR